LRGRGSGGAASGDPFWCDRNLNRTYAEDKSGRRARRGHLSPRVVVLNGGTLQRPGLTEAMREEDERVILVDADDAPVGTAGKLEAHERGELHRAFSVFAVNRRGEILLQRRAAGKYHGAGLWSNSCCGHPRP